MKQFEAEEWVIGAILINPENFERVRFMLSPDDFSHPSHKKIFQVMEDVERDGAPLDITTISALLESKEIEIAKFLKDDVPTGETLKHWMKVVKKRSLEARLREEVREGVDVDTRKIEKLAYEINALQNNAPLYRSLKDIPSTGDDPMALIKTGFIDLDRHLKFSAGQVLMVAGRTGTGKTSFGLQALHYMSQVRPVGVVSLEMSEGEIRDRVFNSFGDLPENFFISDPSTLSSLDLKHRCKAMKSEQGVEVVLVDYLQLMREREDFRSRHLEVSHIIRRIKEFAKELKLAFIVVSSLSRGNEEGRPTLSLLKESGDIEFASDGVLFIHPEKEENLKSLVIAKNRFGWTGDVKVFWDGPKTRFSNYRDKKIEGPQARGNSYELRQDGQLTY